MSNTSLRIVVLGYLIRGPLGGLVWHHLQYVLGLARLGHDVVFLEDSGDISYCYDPVRDIIGADATYGLRYVTDLFDSYSADGLQSRWGWFDAPAKQWMGPMAAHAVDFCRSADLVLNLSGINPLREWLSDIPIRVFVDTDPAFTQIRHLTEPSSLKLALEHNRFFSFGENIRTASSLIPDDGLPWRPTRQPIVLDCWTMAPLPGPANRPLTTVMQWDSYSSREWNEVFYGMKSASFTPYQDLPLKSNVPFELALGGGSEIQASLSSLGWRVRNPLTLLPTPWHYQQYIADSMGEFTVAKQGYVISRSGWFSERSAAYLASGRPVITQDTGISSTLPIGDGLMVFSTPDQAVAAIQDVSSSYERHCFAARDLAINYFDSTNILNNLIATSFD